VNRLSSPCGSSRKDLREFQDTVQDHLGYALYVAQQGGKHRDAKTLTGFGGAGVVEIVKDYRRRHVPRGVHGAISGGGVRASHLPEEIEDRTRDAAPGCRVD
jgi:phage-related protein